MLRQFLPCSSLAWNFYAIWGWKTFLLTRTNSRIRTKERSLYKLMIWLIIYFKASEISGRLALDHFRLGVRTTIKVVIAQIMKFINCHADGAVPKGRLLLHPLVNSKHLSSIRFISTFYYIPEDPKAKSPTNHNGALLRNSGFNVTLESQTKKELLTTNIFIAVSHP